MTRFIGVIICLMVCLSLVGCATVSVPEKVQYQTISERCSRVGVPTIEEKNPLGAALLNLLPGIGNIYLEQPGIFVANLLTYPLSILWGVPQAAIDACTINKKYNIAYFTYGLGKDDLEKAEALMRK